jgi:ABC-type multidrug transport system fused ATPase/permease subunit
MLVGGVALLCSQVACLFLPFSTKYLIDQVVVARDLRALFLLCAAIILAILVEAASLFLAVRLLGRVAELVIVRLRERVHTHIIHLPLDHFEKNSTGGAVSLIMSDIESLRELIGLGVISSSLAIISAILTVLFLLEKNSRLTIIALCMQVIAALTLRKAFNLTRPIMRTGSEIRARVTARLMESFSAISIVKSYRAEQREVADFARGNISLFDNTMRTRAAIASTRALAATLSGLTAGAVVYFGGRDLIFGIWTTGDYVQFTAMLVYLTNPIVQLVNITPQFTQAIASLDRVHEVLDEDLEAPPHPQPITLETLNGDVAFEGVYFCYHPRAMVLNGITFRARPGTLTAIVGPSGSGKSTIISLLCALRRPTSGRILVDEIDLQSINVRSYRSFLSVVSQEIFTFDGTIRENIIYPQTSVPDSRFLYACQIACVNDFAEDLVSGYDTQIGERGVKLSGGQRQRLSLARAVLANPRILLLDEATSSLDSESEAVIHSGVSKLMQHRTTFIVAHRLSTVRDADQILFVDAGRVVEQGTHEELYNHHGRYYDLCVLQLETGRIASRGVLRKSDHGPPAQIPGVGTEEDQHAEKGKHGGADRCSSEATRIRG